MGTSLNEELRMKNEDFFLWVFAHAGVASPIAPFVRGICVDVHEILRFALNDIF